MVTTGKRFTPKETERYIDAVTVDDIKRVAQKYLWDKDVSVGERGEGAGRCVRGGGCGDGKVMPRASCGNCKKLGAVQDRAREPIR
jgi:hypothetical protein